MMTSWNGNIFRVTGPLCEKFISHRWIPLAKASDAELWCFLWSVPWINGWINNREAGDLRRHCAHYNTILKICKHHDDVNLSEHFRKYPWSYQTITFRCLNHIYATSTNFLSNLNVWYLWLQFAMQRTAVKRHNLDAVGSNGKIIMPAEDWF